MLFRSVETLGIDLKLTWNGVRKSWIEAVKRELTFENRPSGWCNPPERIVFPNFTRGSISAFPFWLYFHQNRHLSPSFTVKTDYEPKQIPFSFFNISSQYLISRPLSHVAAVQESDLLIDGSVLM